MSTSKNEITEGNLLRGMISFSIPYLISCFLQTFYGMADLFVMGQFTDAAAVSAVSSGSQVMHMLTVIIVGLAMGTTVSISHAIGAKELQKASRFIGNSIMVFVIFAGMLTVGLLAGVGGIVSILSIPKEAVTEAGRYLTVCFIGVPFITAYNVISSIFRGLGDTKRPMYFVAVAGVINIGLDFLLIGVFNMGAAGAALATVVSQGLSVFIALLSLHRFKMGIKVRKQDMRLEADTVRKLIGIGAPIACQDGLIQVSFLIITVIANSRGVNVAAAVGIVEKLIGFFFLVPSAMLSTVSAVTAQNVGAGLHNRGRKALKYGITICLVFGTAVFVLCQFLAPQLVDLFVINEPEVVKLGGQYLYAYALDCAAAGVHFCFSGYFSAYGKSTYSFIHNILSVVLVRVPGAYMASVFFSDNLYPMGLAAPLGSLLSVFICLFLYRHFKKRFSKRFDKYQNTY